MKDYIDYFKSGLKIAADLRKSAKEEIDVNVCLKKMEEAAEFIENVVIYKYHFEKERDKLALYEQGYAVRSYEVSFDDVVWTFLALKYKAPDSIEMNKMIEDGIVIEKNGYSCIDMDFLRKNGEKVA